VDIKKFRYPEKCGYKEMKISTKMWI